MSKGYVNRGYANVLWTDGSQNRVNITADEFDELWADEAVIKIWWE